MLIRLDMDACSTACHARPLACPPTHPPAWLQMEAEAAVGEGVRLFCPNPQCSQLLVADDKREDTPMDCPHCTQPLCANCGVTWHQGMTCQAYQVLRVAVVLC